MLFTKGNNKIGFCASIQKWFVFIVNIILSLFGFIQVVLGCYILAGGTAGLGFASAMFEGNDSAVTFLLVFGVFIVLLSSLGCCGAKRKSKFILWIYAFILFFLIMGQSVGVVIVSFTVTFGNAVFESLWKKFSVENIERIQNSFECCSFNGVDANDTWPADAEEWTRCSAANDWDPMETCWGKFDSSVTDHFDTLCMVGAIVLGVQVLTYFFSHYVIHSIANAEGLRKSRSIRAMRSFISESI